MRLPQVLDLGAAALLHKELDAKRGQPLSLDCSDVERLGGLCLQVLLAAQARWRADGMAFELVEPSPAFLDGVKLMAAHDLAPREGVE